ncbi:hypothetical protein D9M72_537980 [compost metagenome]
MSRLLEAEAQDPFDARARENRGLDRDFIARSLMHAAAGAGIFAFGILADAEDVEIVRLQRTLHARQQPVRPDIGILHESLADRQEQAVE